MSSAEVPKQAVTVRLVYFAVTLNVLVQQVFRHAAVMGRIAPQLDKGHFQRLKLVIPTFLPWKKYLVG